MEEQNSSRTGTSAKAITVLIIDDSRIHIEGIKYILRYNKNIHIIGEAHTTDEAKQYLQQYVPDVALIDISLENETDGIDVACYLRDNFPQVKVTILSHYKRVDYIIKALQAKVRAYLAKDTVPDDLVKAIFFVSQGSGIFLGDTLPYEKLLDVFGNKENLDNGKPYELTEREVQIIGYLAKGYCSKEIGAILNINKNAIESHKEHIKTKLGVGNVIEMVVFAIKHNIIIID